MVYVKTKNLVSGMVTAKENQFVKNGARLTPEIIKKVKRKKIPGIYIEDDISKKLVCEQLKMVTADDLNVHGLKAVSEEIVNELIVNNLKPLNMDMYDLREFDVCTYKHSVNVAILSTALALRINMPQKEVFDLCLAALLHDLGKLRIPEEILNKPDRLTPSEFAVIKTHPVLSYNLVKNRQDISYNTKRAILCHHENVDGSGYPYGLYGNELPVFAQILHVVDVYDALTSKRPYKEAFNPLEANAFLIKNKDILFSSQIVDEFTKLIIELCKPQEDVV